MSGVMNCLSKSEKRPSVISTDDRIQGQIPPGGARRGKMSADRPDRCGETTVATWQWK